MTAHSAMASGAPVVPACPGSPRLALPRLGYVLGSFPVLSETFVLGEVAQVARNDALGPVFVFERRGDVPVSLHLARHLHPVAGLRPAAVPSGRGLISALAVLGHLPWRRGLSVLRHATRIAAAARAAKVDHLHSHFGGGAALHGLVAARLAGVGFSLTLHSGRFERNFDGPEERAALIAHADTVIGATAALTTAAQEAGARRAITVACGVDLDRFALRAGPVHNGRLLFVGRLIHCKGLDAALQALALIDPARRPGLDIVGTGPEEAALSAQAAALRLDTRFLGARPNDWFAQAGGDYLGLVAPFRVGRDGQVDSGPMVLKEALALGLPVITTDLEGPRDILGGLGETVPVDRPEALAAAIRRVLALGGPARRAHARQARARAEGFGAAEQARAILAVAARGLG